MKTNTENNANETFLSDWISGKITDEKLKSMVSESDFKAFQKLQFSLKAVDVTAPDMSRNFMAIQEKIANKKSHKKSKILSLVFFNFFGLLFLHCGKNIWRKLIFLSVFDTIKRPF